MQTEKLKDLLISDFSPVKPLSPVWQRILLFSVIGFGVVSLYIAIEGAPIFKTFPLLSIPFLLPVLCLLSMFYGSVATAARLSVPGFEVRDIDLGFFLGGVSLWFGYLLSTLGDEAIFLAASANAASEPGYLCCVVIFALTAILTPVAVYLLCRGAPTRPLLCAFSAVFACSSLASLGLHFVCQNCTGEHVLLWHILPLFVVPAVILLIAQKFIRQASLI